jgi:hypothetical protein
MSTIIIPVNADTNMLDLRTLLVRSNITADARIAYSLKRLGCGPSGVRIPAEARDFLARRPIQWVPGFFAGDKAAGV